MEGINKTIELETIDTSLSEMRLTLPGQVQEIQKSLSQLGQLQPIIVRQEKEKYQLIDGFKRYYASEELGWAHLQAKIIEASQAMGKAMILNYNKGTNSLIEYEEALIVYSLHKDHMMGQNEISEILGYSKTWVCRRIGLIEKLEVRVQDQLRLGKISNSHTRSIVKLPRGNQEELTRVIIRHNLTCRQSRDLIEKYLQTSRQEERSYLINNPIEALKMGEKKNDIHDCRLSPHGNRLLKTSEILINQQQMFTGQYMSQHTSQLEGPEKDILKPKIEQVLKKSQVIIQIINKKQKDDERH